MSAPGAVGTDPGPASAAPAARRWAVRALVGLGLAIVVVGVLALSASFSNRTSGGALDLDAASPDGSRALGVLLARRVAVDEVTEPREALDVARGGDVTVLVTTPYQLAEQTLRDLAALPPSVRVVLVEPDRFILDELDLGVSTDYRYADDEAVPPGCALPEAVSAGDAEAAGARYEGPEEGVVACYDRGLLVLDRPGRAEFVLLSSAAPLTNDRLDDAGNAALALGLLTAHPRTLWLDPTSPEAAVASERSSLTDILPPWVLPATLLLAAAGVLAALWRARRLGPPVVEPLPVIVRSAETVEGRSRLYRRARARPAAHEALRAAALARILPTLGLGPTPAPRPLVEAVSDRSGRSLAEVHALLYGPAPVDDRGLVEVASALDALVADALDPDRSTARGGHPPRREGHSP